MSSNTLADWATSAGPTPCVSVATADWSKPDREDSSIGPLPIGAHPTLPEPAADRHVLCRPPLHSLARGLDGSLASVFSVYLYPGWRYSKNPKIRGAAGGSGRGRTPDGVSPGP